MVINSLNKRLWSDFFCIKKFVYFQISRYFVFEDFWWSGSGIQIQIEQICWIRFKLIRIRNTGDYVIENKYKEDEPPPPLPIFLYNWTWTQMLQHSPLVDEFGHRRAMFERFEVPTVPISVHWILLFTDTIRIKLFLGADPAPTRKRNIAKQIFLQNINTFMKKIWTAATTVVINTWKSLIL